MKQRVLTLRLTIALLFSLNLSACIQPVTPPIATLPSAEKTVEITIPEMQVSLKINLVTPYGQFNGIDYIKYIGNFSNTTQSNPFNAPFEIITPADPSQGNGRLLIEPIHFVGGATARDAFLTPELLFGYGFSHAAIC